MYYKMSYEFHKKDQEVKKKSPYRVMRCTFRQITNKSKVAKLYDITTIFVNKLVFLDSI
jgi:hypothetical protein